ncbi:unnamed protein product [Notodromas monacha]|uniref:Insulin gene enhancer protein ISL-1 n=1 Tax=Notodromas monacha TaxID=399045 RepID=A0A7R9BFG1_9CRUS|nr:unnamed protein product [Notodromas monacha]CAG0914311.1 unnamed protein product [Notodromas monacha]
MRRIPGGGRLPLSRPEAPVGTVIPRRVAAAAGRSHHQKYAGERRRASLCVGCGSQIYDQYILRVAPDLEWHAACLKCADCHQFLDETCTCFVRDGKTYCKRDYVRLFGTKCSKCGTNFKKLEYVFRARDRVYHMDCFRCVACDKQLMPGDEFALRPDGLFCKADHEVVKQEDQTTPSTPTMLGGDSNNNTAANLNNSNSNHSPASNNSNTSSNEQTSVRSKESSGNERGKLKSSEGKTTRVRTVLNEKQLHTLRTCYNANPRPDALMKEQLVEMTGLSPRVIRVWFQNKRCKDKKKSILIKHMQQQEKDGRTRLGLGGMQGVPMVASSPVRHESPLSGIQPVEVTSYQPPWKALADFAMQGDLDRIDPQNPPFQQLVNQMMNNFLKNGMIGKKCNRIASENSSGYVFLRHAFVGLIFS